jgi:MFS family permease
VGRNRVFLLLAVSTAFVGATVGVERSVLALLGEEKFQLSSQSAIASFLLGFGLAKALANLASGPLSARLGPGRLLVAGWAIGAAVPGLILVAPSWFWIVAANVLLGVSQGICWSVALVGMVNLAGPRRRGIAAGLNELAGYGAAALAAASAAALAAARGLEVAPFALMQALALGGLGTALAVARAPAASGMQARDRPAVSGTGAPDRPAAGAADGGGPAGFPARFRRLSFTDRRSAALNASGLATNLSDALAWAVLPVFFVRRGLPVLRIGLLSALYPAVWAAAQPLAGWASDRLGRRPMIVAGLGLQAVSVSALAGVESFGAWMACMVGLGLGTAAVYPTLVAAVTDLAPPGERAVAIGVYRLWRDLGYVAGALVAGVVADLAGYGTAIQMVAVLTAGAAFLVVRAGASPRPTNEVKVSKNFQTS